MPAESLHAPWRIEYLRSLEKTDTGQTCFMCEAAAATTADQRRQLLVLWSSELSVVMMNKFPYVNGHLLIAPKAHLPDMEQLDEPLLTRLANADAALRLLKQALSPQGFNLGINLGRCAGAGVPGHLHQHIVPRWAGDTNFIRVVGEVRIIPRTL